MSGKIPQAQVQQLKIFVDLCKEDANILHLPELAFFKSWLEGMDATIPAVHHQHAPPKFKAPEPEPESESEESDIELDNTGVVDDPDDSMPVYPDMDIDITEEMMDESNEKRQKAMEALNEGNLDEAVNMLTEAIKLNPSMATLYAKRASVYIRMKKLKAAIHDCDKGIGLNPDTAPPYKFRGKAKMMLGLWEDAYHDLTLALKLDYDDDTNEMLKQVKPNALNIQAHHRKYELKREEKAEKARMEKVRKAKEANEQARKGGHSSGEHGFPGGFPGGRAPGGGGGGMPDMSKLLQDPELLLAFQDPEVSSAFMDISQNPANMQKYQNNPKIQKIIQKISKKFGGAGAAGGAHEHDGDCGCKGDVPHGGKSAGGTHSDLGVD